MSQRHLSVDALQRQSEKLKELETTVAALEKKRNELVDIIVALKTKRDFLKEELADMYVEKHSVIQAKDEIIASKEKAIAELSTTLATLQSQVHEHKHQM